MNWDLRQNWRWAPLGELVTAVRRQVRPETLEPSCQYIGLEHVARDTGELTSIDVGTAELRSSKFAFDAGDLLYGKLRPNLRKCAVVSFSGVSSTDLIPLRPVIPASAQMLAFQLRSEPFADRVMSVIAGANLPRVAIRDLLQIPVPVPPSGEAGNLYRIADAANELRMAVRAFEKSVEDVENAVTFKVLGVASPDEAPAVTQSSLGSS